MCDVRNCEVILVPLVVPHIHRSAEVKNHTNDRICLLTLVDSYHNTGRSCTANSNGYPNRVQIPGKYGENSKQLRAASAFQLTFESTRGSNILKG